MMIYDSKPDRPRHPIQMAGDLVRRGDPLSLEAGNVIGELVDQVGQRCTRCGYVKHRCRGKGLVCPYCPEEETP